MFFQNSQLELNPKMGHFGFFQLIKNNAETFLLTDEKYIS